MDETGNQEAGRILPAVHLRDDGRQDIPHWLAQPYIRQVVVSVQDLKIRSKASCLDKMTGSDSCSSRDTVESVEHVPKRGTDAVTLSDGDANLIGAPKRMRVQSLSS